MPRIMLEDLLRLTQRQAVNKKSSPEIHNYITTRLAIKGKHQKRQELKICNSRDMEARKYRPIQTQ